MSDRDWRGLTVFARQSLSRGEEAVSVLRTFMQTVEGDRLTLLTILSQGPSHFRNVMRAETKGYAIDDAMIDLVWGWLDARKGVNPEVEREWLETERKQAKWKQDAIDTELARLSIAAKHNLRVKGDQLFDGETVTTGVDDPRLPHAS